MLSATIEGWYNEDGERIDTIHIYSDTTYIIRLVNCKVNAIYTAGVNRDIPSSTGVLLAGKLTDWRSYVDDSALRPLSGWYEQGTRRAGGQPLYGGRQRYGLHQLGTQGYFFVPNGKAGVMMADDTTRCCQPTAADRLLQFDDGGRHDAPLLVLPVPTARRTPAVFVGWTNSTVEVASGKNADTTTAGLALTSVHNRLLTSAVCTVEESHPDNGA